LQDFIAMPALKLVAKINLVKKLISADKNHDRQYMVGLLWSVPIN